MPSYLALINYTDEGIRNVSDSVSRASNFREAVESAGGKVNGLYWSFGDTDGVVLFDAPDESTAASLMLGLSKRGFVRTKTLRLFDEDAFAQIASS